MSLPRYPEYQESGVEWLGTVPAHWELSPLKHLADFLNGCVFKPGSWSETGTPIVRIENLNGSLSFNYYNGDVEPKHHVRKGDLLFGWSGNRGTSFGPFIWSLEGSFFLNQHIFKVVPANCDTRWLFWCLRAVTAHVEDQATGIIGMVHVTKGDLGAIKVPLSPLEEQRSQAAFLDRETAKIDALIAEQEKLLALLAEKRQATISHAVTRGLDPNAPMKDSGIPWLGDVPAHWWVGPLRRIVNRVDTGGTPSNDPPSESIECGVPWITPGDFTGDLDLKSASKAVSVQQVQKGEAKCFPADAIFIVGIGATLGKVGLFGSPASANQQINAITMQGAHVSRFFAYSLSAKVEVMRYLSNASTIGIMNQSKTKDIYIAVPPRTEQIEIASYLDGAMSRFSILEIQVRDAITLLEERRIALIAAAVTGQIDVRGVVEPEAA